MVFDAVRGVELKNRESYDYTVKEFLVNTTKKCADTLV